MLDLSLGSPELRSTLGKEARGTIEKKYEVKDVAKVMAAFLLNVRKSNSAKIHQKI